MRSGLIRERGIIGSARMEPTHGLWTICRTSNCRQMAVVEGMCEDCYTEDKALEELAFDRALKEYRAAKRSPYAAWARKHAERLSDFAWLAFFVVLVNAVGYYVWPYVWATFQLWFGSGQ